MARSAPRSAGWCGLVVKQGPDLRVSVERVTRIELALSAWESERTPTVLPLICGFECPQVTA
jgi:hypothetical protein